MVVQGRWFALRKMASRRAVLRGRGGGRRAGGGGQE